MDEILEAEAFCRDLDALMSGAVDATTTKDLELSLKMSRLDFSGESRVRRSLKDRLLRQDPTSLWARLWTFLTDHPKSVGAAFAAAAVALVLAPAMKQARPSAPPQGAAVFGPISSNGLSGSRGSGFKGLARGPGAGLGSKFGSLERLKAAAGSAGGDFNRAGSAANALEAAAGRDMGADKPDRDSKWADAFIAGKAAPDTAPRAHKFGGLRGGAGSSFSLAPAPPYETAEYGRFVENAYQKAVDHPLSTFSIDVDGASYANVRRFLNDGLLPPKDAVRVEEMVNYFHYDYPEPRGEAPFSITAEVGQSPWEPGHQLVRIALKGKTVAAADLPPSNLVFLIDSSGSMQPSERLPLLKEAFRLLVQQLRPQDRVAIVTYAGNAGIVLPPTSGNRKEEIVAALDRLEAGGSTAGGAGIELAYKVAAQSFMKNGNNRVILATDGDFNVGVTSDGELVRLIEEKRKSGVFLTALGVGTDNLKDAKMKQLADHGNGNYYYLDDILEAKRVFVHQMGGTLYTVAKDVKLQIEFNPARVEAYRLIGYESRMLQAQDFNNDKKDAGELGAGHTVTALYEIVPTGVPAGTPSVDPLKYQKSRPADEAAASDELLTVKFRYKDPAGTTSKLLVETLKDEKRPWAETSGDFRFASSVAGFGMLLRGSEFKGDLTYGQAQRMAAGAVGRDEGGYRAELVRLIEKAELLDAASRR